MGRQAIEGGVSQRPRLDAALRDALIAFAVSRAFVWVGAVVAVAVLGADAGSASAFGRPELTHPFGEPLDTLFSPLARWDSIWYLGIAHDGYAGASTAFFPLYPLLVRALAPVGTPWALLASAYAVSLASFAGALVLLRRLVELELGADAARRALFLLAFFPGALWFGVPYSESVFLLLSVGAIYAARTNHWAWAGVCAALASGTRSAGIVLLVPLAMIAWRRRDRAAVWLALAPAGLAAYSGYLAATQGDAFAYLHLQDTWFRSFAGPFGAIVDGMRAAWDGALQLISGSHDHIYFPAAGGDPFIAAAHNLELFAFLVFGVVATIGALRRLPRPYGAYVVAALALPLSFPVEPQPLMSLPRFLAVLFPSFMWIALKPRAARVAFGVFVLLLGVFTVRYATWHWVA